MNNFQVDVLIIGAGISGVGAAYHLQRFSPDRSYAIVEARSRMGGTWDLFKYPGIRSDSDMYTFGFNFKPWVEPEAIAPGAKIQAYIDEAATENGIKKNIRFGQKVIAANWDSATCRWTSRIQDVHTDEVQVITSRFFYSCGGYYNYEQGYSPEFKDSELFSGIIVHPQQWPEALDYSGKKVVVIGSGATAVTLVPAMAKTAAHVTMLQRSPSYVVSRPLQQDLAIKLNKWLPAKLAYSINRWKNILLGMYFFRLSKKKPDAIKKYIIDGVRQALPKGYDVAKHFTPDYKPWDQRVCSVTDADLFESISDGSASVVTDYIESFTATGIKLKSGDELQADIIITATGLKLEMFSGMEISVDEVPLKTADCFVYKGMMLSGVPNFVYSVGYTNASWTLKSDLVGKYVSRLLNHMKRTNSELCVPVVPAEGLQPEPIIDFKSGYVLRAQDEMPKQASRKPWRLYQNYILDRITLGGASVVDDSISFKQR
ncbi:MAG: monooxygenase [Cryomorphaceae bacterium]|jgi:monooxygenase